MAVLLTVLLVTLAASCGDDDTAADPGPTATDTSAPSDPAGTDLPVSDTSTSAPSTTQQGSEEDQVLAAVQCYWDTLVEANSPPDPDHPGFDQCFTGRAFETSHGNVLNRLATGQVVSDPNGIEARSIEVVSIEGDTALVKACFVDDGVLMDTFGNVLNDEVVTLLSELTVERDSLGAWRVEHAFLAAEFPGDAPCP